MIWMLIYKAYGCLGVSRMIDTDEYIEMWNDHLLGSEGVQDLMNALIAEVKRLREQNKLMVDYFRFMRDGGFTDADWITVNKWIGDEEE